MSGKTRQDKRIERHARVRARVSGTAERPRLAVFKASQHIYAQAIDDARGATLAHASDLEIKEKGLTKTKRAERVGELIAERMLAKGITKVVFDRGGFAYRGRVSALSEAARKKGVSF